MNNLVTICARGGSKGLPDKAILPMNGKPLIQWTLEHAIGWGNGLIIACSDSARILSLCSKVKQVLRPDELAQDDTAKIDVLRWLLKKTEEIENKRFDYVIDLDITNPLRRISDIEACYNKAIDENCNVVFSVTNARRNPYFNQVEYCNGKHKTPASLVTLSGRREFRSRQEVPPIWDLNASIYIYKTKWLRYGYQTSPIAPKCSIYLMPEWTGFDVDSRFDFELVEWLQKKYLL